MTRYELLDRIGVGGMAEIFRGKAVAAGGFEKPVAIKRILPHLSQDKRFVELLIAEAKILSMLKHRNIVQIFDVGLGDDGKYFLVMEYVDGKDVGAVQRGLEASRGRLAFDLALHIGAEICEALEHAHTAHAPDGRSMSLVHRDVSPSNVLLSRAGEVKLTDFGIAKRAEQESTGHGAVRGKFAYISPEQARNEHVDPRSDVFSVGILLWELVTGRRLFSGLSDMDALRAVRDPVMPRPREIDSRLGADIDALIMQALAREARGRPTAGQLCAKLRSLRYSLDVTVGDPATELAKIIDTAEAVERQSSRSLPRRSMVEMDGGEPTVIRIHTADAFSMRDDGAARAREVIDRFEEEETRQAQLSGDQISFLRRTAGRDSAELTSAADPPLPGVRPWHPPSGPAAPARQRHPPSTDDLPTIPPEADQSFDGDEATRLVAPTNRRTPGPERVDRNDRFDRSERAEPRSDRRLQPRPTTQPPPLQPPPLGPPPVPQGLASRESSGAFSSMPGTIQERLPQQMMHAPLAPVIPLRPSPMSHPPPPQQLAQGPAMPLPPPPTQPPQLAPPPPMLPPQPMIQPSPPPGQQPPGYRNWGAPPQLVLAKRPPSRPGERTAVRKSQLRPWMLIIGALAMAFLAFAVTRACIHTAQGKPPVETHQSQSGTMPSP